MEISESITATSESEYLIISHKKKCSEILGQRDLKENDIIDFYVSLHIVLEVSLNTLFRHLSLKGIVKPISKADIVKNLDEVSFIHKVTMFIYNSSFIFPEADLSKAGDYHQIIGKIKKFSGIRNKLLHGHSISTSFKEDGAEEHSPTRELITQEKVEEQIELFKDIAEGMKFYLDHLKSTWTPAGIETLKTEYLDSSFL